MVGIKRDIGLVFLRNLYRERWLCQYWVLQINLLSDLYFLCSPEAVRSQR